MKREREGRARGMRLPLELPAAAPLRDVGVIAFASEHAADRRRLRDTIRRQSAAVPGLADTPEGAKCAYDNSSELLRLLHRLQSALQREETERLQFQLTYDSHSTAWTSLSSLFESVSGRGVSEYILYRYFSTHFQPIVQPDGQIAGYECLLRPLPEQPPFRPAELFDKARKIGLHTFLDREARLASIRVSGALLPPGVKRFINFLPSSLICKNKCLQSTFEAIRATGTDFKDVVFEVAETEPLDDPALPDIVERYRREGVQVAVDDVGAGCATIGLLDRLQPDYVKLDRSWISGCDRDAEKQRHIQQAMERTARFRGVVLAEGVEREQEWNFLRVAGVPLFQGYLFGKASPVPMTNINLLTRR